MAPLADRLITAVVRDQRCRRRNQRIALERLAELAAQDRATHEEGTRTELHRLHHRLQGGSPARIFEGLKFRVVDASSLLGAGRPPDEEAGPCSRVVM